jgi:hypothetical protein
LISNSTQAYLPSHVLVKPRRPFACHSRIQIRIVNTTRPFVTQEFGLEKIIQIGENFLDFADPNLAHSKNPN